MEWYQILSFIAASSGTVAMVYEYIKLRRYLKSAEKMTVEQAEPQIRKHLRNTIIWLVIMSVLVISSIVVRAVLLLGEIL